MPAPSDVTVSKFLRQLGSMEVTGCRPTVCQSSEIKVIVVCLSSLKGSKLCCCSCSLQSAGLSRTSHTVGMQTSSMYVQLQSTITQDDVTDTVGIIVSNEDGC